MDSYDEYLVKKKREAIKEIQPLCKFFGIKCDYIVDIKRGSEILVLNGQKICCSADSISAIKDEVIGYIFVKIYCNHRSIGKFETQTLNAIRRYWFKEG